MLLTLPLRASCAVIWLVKVRVADAPTARVTGNGSLSVPSRVSVTTMPLSTVSPVFSIVTV